MQPALYIRCSAVVSQGRMGLDQSSRARRKQGTMLGVVRDMQCSCLGGQGGKDSQVRACISQMRQTTRCGDCLMVRLRSSSAVGEEGLRGEEFMLSPAVRPGTTDVRTLHAAEGSGSGAGRTISHALAPVRP